MKEIITKDKTFFKLTCTMVNNMNAREGNVHVRRIRIHVDTRV